MKKYLYILGLLSVLGSCSPDDRIIPEEEHEVNLEVEVQAVSVDEVVTITVNSSQPLQQVARITEDAVYSWDAFGEVLPESFEMHFKFPFSGSKTLTLRFTFSDQEVITKELHFEVERGNTVQITRIEVNTFSDINGTWDPEFSEEDPERLADVMFSLEKLFPAEFTSDETSKGLWFLSEVKHNQGDLSWELSDEGLFIDPMQPFYFGLADDDGDGTAQNLLDRPSRQIFLKDYKESRPESISLVDAASNLQVRFYLNWP